jgi:hypothetical protein
MSEIRTSECNIEITGTAEATKGTRVTEVTIVGKPGKVTIGESTTKVSHNHVTKSTKLKVPCDLDARSLLICLGTPDGERAIKSPYKDGQGTIKIEMVATSETKNKGDNTIKVNVGGGDDDALTIIKAYDEEAVRIGKDVAKTIADAVTAAAEKIIGVIKKNNAR